MNGTRLTGANAAWVGNAHNAAVTVISDTQVKVTVPAGATTGAIGIFNPLYTAFAPGKFTVAASTTTAYAQPSISSFAPVRRRWARCDRDGRGFTGPIPPGGQRDNAP